VSNPDRARFDAWASQWGGEMGLHHLDLDGLWLAWQEAVRLEREACAKVCDDFHEGQNGRDNYGKFIARLIRSRALQQGD
jgi:hypothetical protein